MSAANLVRLVEALGAPYGLERSVKITPGSLADDRCLISIGRAALGASPANRLIEIGQTLQMPSVFADGLRVALDGADIVHFGFEAVDDDVIYKIYLEYASQVRQAMAAGSRAPRLVHLAYKWSAKRADSHNVSRYTWLPCGSRADIDAKLRDLVPETEAADARRCVLELLSRIARFADSGELLLMEVEEPGNPRRSCDLNVYDAGLRMEEIADLVAATLRDFAVPQARAQALFGRIADRALGHISAGLGRDGKEFVTFYFGVESH
jgi:tryptophan halogenase